MIYNKRMRENYVVNVTKFVSQLMPKCQEFIVHYMTLNIRENTPLPKVMTI